MHVKSFVVSPVQSNCYVLSESMSPGAKSVIIDPGDINLTEVFTYIEVNKLHVIANWNTHAHFDHVMGVDLVRAKFKVPSLIHRLDLPVWHALPETVERWTGKKVPPLAEPDGYFSEGDVLHLGDASFKVWLTPGHSPGSVCFIGDDIGFTGDTLFAGSIGRTDLPFSDGVDMAQSLQRIMAWPDNLTLYPGHMQSTSMGQERKYNPFL